LSRMLEVRLLGKFDVRCDGKLITISSRPAQSLFAYLILSAGTSHRREKLAGLLWPDSLEETARDNLRHALWRVRKALESASSTRFLHTDDVTISFKESSDYWLDAADLEKLNENAPTDELIAVLSNYQGELLPGFYDEWVVLEREHLYSIFEHHMARLMSLLQDEKRWLDILDWGERWIKLGQKPEPAYRALMSAHAAKGAMSRVAATYERCVKSLMEFGVEPSEQTRTLYERLKAGKETIETGSTVRVPLGEKRKELPTTNLPVPLTSFIGREKEVEEIVKLFGKNRLVTLMGSGGVGKTRLAIEAGNKLISKFKEGVWWIDLAALNDPLLVPQEVAKVVDAREIPNQPLIETLIEHLQSKQLLLILDNCEHLISACAQLADRLLSGCKGLKILATSREALDILGETPWPVPSLSLPNIQETLEVKSLSKFESIRLFTDRARRVQSKFELATQNAKTVVQICHRLSGMPLAIELAAARVKMMSVDEIARRLEDRFDLLAAGSRTALPRHQTLRATIDWSYDLLSAPERSLFRRLSVFAGGFTLASAEKIVADENVTHSQVLDLLGQLINKSLVTMEPRAGDTETRYGMLETLREYARQKLEETGESREVRDRHLDYFVGLAEEAEPKIFGSESVTYFKRLDQDLDNIRVAMEWSIESRKVMMAFRLAAALYYFWYNRSPTGGEWQRQLNKALFLPEGSKRTAERAKALNATGFFYWADVNPVNPRLQLEEALSIGREIEDNSIIARSLCNLGLIESVEGNYAEARSLLQQGVDLWQELGPERKMEYIWALIFLGDVALNQKDLQEAEALYEISTNALRGIGDLNFLAYSVRRLGQLAWYRGQFERATMLYVESLTLNQALKDERGVIACLSASAGIALARGQTLFATQLFSAVQALLSARGIRLLPVDRLEYDRNVSSLRARLDRTTLERAWSKGESMTLEQAIEFALQGSHS
jgi:predicted ATPase/DNA-binding SARP family transcriptional activator